jgi:hypothetical protein
MAKADDVAHLALGPLILLRAGGVVTGEVEVAECCTCSGHHLLKLLLLSVPEAILLLTLALVAGVILVVVVVLVGGVKLLPLGAVNDEVGGVTALEAALRRSPPLLAELVQSLELSCKEDKANSKADESVVLVGLATWPPTRALVIKALLEKEAS